MTANIDDSPCPPLSHAEDVETPASSIVVASKDAVPSPQTSTPTSTSSTRCRLESIDILRGVAIIFMVMAHFCFNWSPCRTQNYNDALCQVVGHLSSGSAPTFTFLVGLSLQLSLDKQRRATTASNDHNNNNQNDQNEPTIALRTSKRSLAVFIIGLVFSFSVWGPYDVFEWDILTLIGSAIGILYWLQRLVVRSSLALAALSLTFIVVSPLCRDLSHYDAYWNHMMYEYQHEPRDILTGFFVNGYFPLLPWLLYPTVGMIVGQLLPLQQRQVTKVWLGGLLGTGMLMIGLAVLITQTKSHLGYYDNYFSFYPASTPFLLTSLGIILVLFAVLYQWLDALDPITQTQTQQQRSWDNQCVLFIRNFLARYSHFSLTVYVLHHSVLQWSLYLAAWANGHYAYYYFENAMNPSQAFGLSLVFLALCYGLLFCWEKYAKGIGSMEWFLSKGIN